MVERRAPVMNGFLGVFLIAALIVTGVLSFLAGRFILGGVLVLIGVVAVTGILIVQPNQAVVLTFFGKYLGSVRKSGLWLTVPLVAQRRVSLRVRNFNSNKLKVNDIEGNPIEIAAVVVFRVVDSAKAVFDVDDYEAFVEIQSETALRHIASMYPYDAFDSDRLSLRANTEEIATELSQNLQDRLAVAGVEVMEARLTHLAYATEIAAAMLQRQQAAAIVAARQKVVEGAVGMVQEAIERLLQEGVVELDEEKKATMINNLLVAIVSDRAAQPVINTGTIY
ncbi:MAG: hypothetical protein BAA01_10605 [Bacillus thermozeamaize]|uniref:Band 7 domain-containing protein n=1 Tax=Bacillus thermozeamaize TaxID=230954 RepID=A0A1Y3PDV6_9BACI|nr:MAG: hypothetical protein BAA01_10605 [Bacillus thermozeamaize]